MKKTFIAALALSALSVGQASAQSSMSHKVKLTPPKGSVVGATHNHKSTESKSLEKTKLINEIKPVNETNATDASKEVSDMGEEKSAAIHHHKFLNKADNFEGLNASLGLGVTGYSSSTQYYYVNHDDGLTSDSHHNLGNITTNGVVNLSYLKALSSKWLVGIGVSHDLNSSRTGGDQAFSGGTNFSATTKIKSHQSVYIQPTYALSRTNALFAKLAYHKARATIKDSNQLYSGFTENSRDLNGIGYGFGLMTFIDKNIFLKTEIEFVNYQRVHVDYPQDTNHGNLTYKLSSVSGIVSLGYRF